MYWLLVYYKRGSTVWYGYLLNFQDQYGGLGGGALVIRFVASELHYYFKPSIELICLMFLPFPLLSLLNIDIIHSRGLASVLQQESHYSLLLFTLGGWSIWRFAFQKKKNNIPILLTVIVFNKLIALKVRQSQGEYYLFHPTQVK